MKNILVTFLAFFFCCGYAQLPHLQKNKYGVTQMVVKGKPFLMLAGELYNSSASNRAYMESTMKTLSSANLNTVFVPISWELIEPKENQFDFSSIDQTLSLARRNNLKIVFLWLATWKNGISPYAPMWLMQNTEQYWRVKNADGKNTQTLSAFCNATLEADKKAYVEVMKHIAKVDAIENTVLAMQVENEVGVFAQTRDFSPPANEAFSKEVPQSLLQYLIKNEPTIEVELKAAWKENGSKTKGSWAEVFGKTDFTDLFFMAWHYGVFVNEIALAGKKIYALPTYINCWMPATPKPEARPNYTKPGTYPSGGPIIMVADIWKAAAPAIDIISPDIYGDDFDLQAGFFHRNDNPLFIPETKAIAGRATYAFANLNAICFSPFGIDDQTDSMKLEYGMLQQMAPFILQYQGSGKMKGFYRNENDTIGGFIALGNDVLLNVHLTRPYTKRNEDLYANGKYPTTYGIVIQTGENECIVAGKNIYVSAKSINPAKEVWLRDVWEGNFSEGKWKKNTLMNGDEAGLLWSKKTPVYRIKSNPTINPPLPTAPAIFRMKALVYDL
ncbi:DUF5597 domain-containing protein [Parasediminibacterium sp. JCM 36343]|uniref:GH35 family beta-galactosidase n=1 Tax=Parasediminibacterium sp. JCM 36343 TaxID=3374279 RepID=UPI00397BD32D